MSIVSSQVIENETRTDRCRTHGVETVSRAVRERHTDHLGGVHERSWSTADLGIDVNAALAAHAAELAGQLAAAEIEANLGEVLA